MHNFDIEATSSGARYYQFQDQLLCADCNLYRGARLRFNNVNELVLHHQQAHIEKIVPEIKKTKEGHEYYHSRSSKYLLVCAKCSPATNEFTTHQVYNDKEEIDFHYARRHDVIKKDGYEFYEAYKIGFFDKKKTPQYYCAQCTSEQGFDDLDNLKQHYKDSHSK